MLRALARWYCPDLRTLLAREARATDDPSQMMLLGAAALLTSAWAAGRLRHALAMPWPTLAAVVLLALAPRLLASHRRVRGRDHALLTSLSLSWLSVALTVATALAFTRPLAGIDNVWWSRAHTIVTLVACYVGLWFGPAAAQRVADHPKALARVRYVAAALATLVAVAVPWGALRSVGRVDPSDYLETLPRVGRFVAPHGVPSDDARSEHDARHLAARLPDDGRAMPDILGAASWGLRHMRTNCWWVHGSVVGCSLSYRGDARPDPDGIEVHLRVGDALEARHDPVTRTWVIVGAEEGSIAWDDRAHRWVTLRPWDHPERFGPGPWRVGAGLLGCALGVALLMVGRRRRLALGDASTWREGTLRDDGVIAFADGTTARPDALNLRPGTVVVVGDGAAVGGVYRGEARVAASRVFATDRATLALLVERSAVGAEALGLACASMLGAPLVAATALVA